MFETPKRFENMFSDDDRKLIYEFLNLPGWETGWKSNVKKDAYSFLHKHFAGYRKRVDGVNDCDDELKENYPLIHNAWIKVRQNCLPGHTLVRCYANGMCYGMDGTVHTDATSEGNYTAIYYPHERWSPNWGGETILYNKEENRVVACFYPKPNSIVVINGQTPHRANGVTRSYTGMRITLMFKTEMLDGAKTPPVPAAA